ncbi:hypothetical protein [Chelativorans sp. Marseille-P2723]|uniref:hypothetical protein n=1 Tax=Chelativorans sp. Marseille-P2723 TaxID=2709133 RepID=UPI00156E2795|nr:hypothetical protein [Chelativorans sp. Marseille-P2723]
MRKILAGVFASAALLGLAACGDTDDTTTQGIEPGNDPAVQQPTDGTTDGGTTDPGTGGAGGTTPAQ